MDVRIKRSEWARGKEGGLLLTSGGKYCALGHYLKAVGVPDEHMIGECSPVHLECDLPESALWLFEDGEESPDCTTITAINDEVLRYEGKQEQVVTDAEREEVIAKVFALNGVTVTFEGE